MKAGRQTVLRESTNISTVLVKCRVSLLSLWVRIVIQHCLLCLLLHRTRLPPTPTLDLGGFCWMDSGFLSNSEIRHAVKSFWFLPLYQHSVENLNYRVRAKPGSGFRHPSPFRWRRLLPVGNSWADHSGNEHSSRGGLPGGRCFSHSWERVGNLGDSESTLWSLTVNIRFRPCDAVTVWWAARTSRMVFFHPRLCFGTNPLCRDEDIRSSVQQWRRTYQQLSV